MAECCICGKVDNTLPKSWTNWECDTCEADLYRTFPACIYGHEAKMMDLIDGVDPWRRLNAISQL